MAAIPISLPVSIKKRFFMTREMRRSKAIVINMGIVRGVIIFNSPFFSPFIAKSNVIKKYYDLTIVFVVSVHCSGVGAQS